jgi:hypothetical protein
MSKQAAGASKLYGITARPSVDHMLRDLQQSQLDLTVLADNKASIVLSIAVVAVTFSASRLGAIDPGTAPYFFVLVIGGTLAGACAAVAPYPKLVDDKRRHDPGHSGAGASPLFFGHIGGLDADEYLEQLAGTIATDANVYHAIAIDVYAKAQVLRHKFRWLRYSYLALLSTLLISAGVVCALAFRGVGDLP